MDVDEDDQGTQRVKRVPDYGIEVDFDSLSDKDRDVCNWWLTKHCVETDAAFLRTNPAMC